MVDLPRDLRNLIPAFRFPEYEPPVTPAIQVNAGHGGDTAKNDIHIDWDLLSDERTPARLRFRNSGKTPDPQVHIEDAAHSVISSIFDRYQQNSSHLKSHSDLFRDQESELVPQNHVTPSKHVSDLLNWQRVIETVEALETPTSDQPSDAFRLKLIDRVELLYTNGFRILRNQLRGQIDGAKTLRGLLESQNEALIDIALRLVAGEPGLADSLQQTLVNVYLDHSLETETRSRAYSRLHPSVQRAVSA